MGNINKKQAKTLEINEPKGKKELKTSTGRRIVPLPSESKNSNFQNRSDSRQFTEDVEEKHKKEVVQDRPKEKIIVSQSGKKTKRQIEADLKKLKELKDKELITQEVWEKKQSELLDDY